MWHVRGGGIFSWCVCSALALGDAVSKPCFLYSAGSIGGEELSSGMFFLKKKTSLVYTGDSTNSRKVTVPNLGGAVRFELRPLYLLNLASSAELLA